MSDDPSWVAVGVRIDSEGREQGTSLRGLELSPDALRKAGIMGALGLEDWGNLHGRIDTTECHRCGIIGYEQILAVTGEIRGWIKDFLMMERRPFVIGGCASLIVGCLAGAAESQDERVGLVHISASPRVETIHTSAKFADMTVTALLGRVSGVFNDGPRRILLENHLALLGYRDLVKAAAPGRQLPSQNLRDLAIDMDAEAVLKRGPGPAGEWAASVISRENQRGIWVHFEPNVLTWKDNPSTDRPSREGGLIWTEVVELLNPLIRHPRLLGFSLAGYNPAKDPGGAGAQAIVKHLASVFGT